MIRARASFLSSFRCKSIKAFVFGGKQEVKVSLLMLLWLEIRIAFLKNLHLFFWSPILILVFCNLRQVDKLEYMKCLESYQDSDSAAFLRIQEQKPANFALSMISGDGSVVL